jgi:hypothetical protein
MAYPTISKPYGFKPINLIGGQVFAGATRKMRIASAYATSIGYGDLLVRATDGTVERSAATTAKPTGGFAGVFLGVEFINPSTGQLQFQQNFIGGTTVTTGYITAYVCDDPDALFQVAVVSGTTVVTGVQYTSVGNNATIVNNTTITNAGNSQVALLDSTADTATLTIRIVDVVPDTAYISGGNTLYPEVIVKFNFGMHAYETAVGV